MTSAVLSELSLLQLPIFIGLIASAWYCLAMLYSAREFFVRRAAAPRDGEWPAITVLKPLKGPDVGLDANLAGLCRQDYPRYQLLFGVADGDDPAAAVVRQLQADYPAVDIQLVIDARIYGTNHKVSNLHNMYKSAKHEVLVIADSDIRVEPDYLRRLAVYLRDARVGLVTCLYRAVNTGGVPTLLESLFINTDFCHMVLVARKVERTTYAFGATIAMRRAVLDEIGGFLPIVDYLADDYQLGQRVVQRGYQLALAEQVVDTVIAVGGWRRLLQHQLRWARTYRICRPGGYFGSVFTHGTLWAVLNLVWHGLGPAAVAASTGLIGLRYLCAAMLSWRYLGASTSLWQLLLVVPKDLLVSLVWFLAFAGDTVVWSGRRFRVLRDGKMVDLTPSAPVPQGAWSASAGSAVSEPPRK